MTDDKAMVKLEELYKLAVKLEDAKTGLAILDYMRKVGEIDGLERSN